MRCHVEVDDGVVTRTDLHRSERSGLNCGSVKICGDNEMQSSPFRKERSQLRCRERVRHHDPCRASPFRKERSQLRHRRPHPVRCQTPHLHRSEGAVSIAAPPTDRRRHHVRSSFTVPKGAVSIAEPRTVPSRPPSCHFTVRIRAVSIAAIRS